MKTSWIVALSVATAVPAFAQISGSSPKSASPVKPESPSGKVPPSTSKARDVRPEPGTGALSLPDFLKTYALESEDLKSAALQVQISEAGVRRSRDTWQSRLELTPSLLSEEQRFAATGITLRNEGTDMSGRIVQLTPLGTELTLSAERAIAERNIGQAGVTDETYSLRLNQPLYRNSFGRLFRLQQSVAEAELGRDQSRLLRQKLETCTVAADLYNESWFAEQRLNLYQQIAESSARALRVAEDQARNRLIRRIDLLSARADNLRASDRVLESTNDVSKAMAALRAYAPLPEGVKLSDPTDWFARPLTPTPEAGTRDNLTLQALEKQVTAADRSVAIARENAKSNVDLVLEAGRSNGRAPYTGGVTDFEENYAKVAVNFSIPLFNESLNSDIAQAFYQKGLAEQSLSGARREVTTGYSQRVADLGTLEEQLKLTDRRVEIYQEQIREAFNLLRTGRIEFEDYLRFRDLYLNEKLRSLELRRNLWTRKQQLAVLTDQTSYVCGEIQ